MMLTPADLEAIASVVSKRDDELWAREDIAQYAKVSERTVRSWSVLPSFPKAVRLPSSRETGHPRYYKSEAVEWIKKHQERN